MRHLLRSCVVSIALLGAVACGPDSAPASTQSAVIEGQGDLLTGADGGSSGKVVVCHIPPGNPANAHTIVVGAPAVAAHLRHGDSLGECSTPGGGGGNTPDGGGNGGGGGDQCQAAEAACSDTAHCCAGLACNEAGVCVTVIN
ncbi:hypothetical protein FGE12_27585 [Aggregicoccus sp. 17bor-14]|uniref:hypothetical protein n=1 Tax=Myxococcaceae TaxID=31 RepID=UPI00129C70C9|nr:MULTISPECIES: hypothetical protein [Myxococcaceae]MBF5046210.1 hypothetical protein [Simulacricoccus sp. 17bor-14]MRI91934.1 hypothetical protein [Aggregicoccus sp. 17bor-14]